MSWVQIKLEQNHMNTTFDLAVSCVDSRARAAEQVLREAHREITRIENELSEFLRGSPVYELNQSSAFYPVPVTQCVRELLKIAASLRDRSEGAFDPLCKSVRTTGSFRGSVVVSEDGKTFFKTEDGVRLGFGAIGKGYALDKVRVLLEQNGFTDYLLSAGGSSILLSGFASPGQHWTWAWSWKKDEGGAYLGKRFAHASGRPIALGVSGTMEQGEHIVGSASAGKAKSLSALVAHGSAARADALSTALFVLGWERLELLRDPLQPTALALIDTEENLSWNGDFQEAWGPACS